MKKWGHDELAEDLATHLRGNSDRMVWTDMQMGPSGSPRPDVYTIAKSFSRFSPLAYECKISVSDFRSDITKGKWQSYLKFAGGVIFAVPAGLIKKEDIPIGCGLIVRHDEVWRSVKGPTLKATETLPRDAWMKLLIDGIDRQAKRDPIGRDANEWRIREVIRKKYGDDLADALSRRDQAVFRLQDSEKKLNERHDQILTRAREQEKTAREQAQKEEGPINVVKVELCKALGIDENSSVWAIQHAAQEAAKRLTMEGEIMHLRRQLESARRSLESGLESIPLIEKENE